MKSQKLTEQRNFIIRSDLLRIELTLTLKENWTLNALFDRQSMNRSSSSSLLKAWKHTAKITVWVSSIKRVIYAVKSTIIVPTMFGLAVLLSTVRKQCQTIHFRFHSVGKLIKIATINGRAKRVLVLLATIAADCEENHSLCANFFS